MSLHHHFEIHLPDWVEPFCGHWLNGGGPPLDTAEHRMLLAVALSAENVRQGTGGPFGAIVVNQATRQLAGIGVNLVTGSGLSIAHAEVVALSLAQRTAENWDLGADGDMQLVSSCEPCAMCLGAIPWSGISSLISGADREDAENAGFDEGDKPLNWVRNLLDRSIETRIHVLREEAARVLQEYASGAGEIYHPARKQ
ncbi:MAG TPA: nucleoside deaminase [Xanthomonadales bacterium]|nr:nucleoside deaminase [Xanthomonadales bacterium]